MNLAVFGGKVPSSDSLPPEPAPLGLVDRVNRFVRAVFSWIGEFFRSLFSSPSVKDAIRPAVIQYFSNMAIPVTSLVSDASHSTGRFGVFVAFKDDRGYDMRVLPLCLSFDRKWFYCDTQEWLKGLSLLESGGPFFLWKCFVRFHSDGKQSFIFWRKEVGALGSTEEFKCIRGIDSTALLKALRLDPDKQTGFQEMMAWVCGSNNPQPTWGLPCLSG